MKLRTVGLLSGLIVLLLSGCGTAVETSGEAELSQKVYAALTFDDGPSADTTPRLLDGLKERGAKATFFLIGEKIEENQDLVLRMRREGHQVGNHTWNHTSLQGLNANDVINEIQQTDTALCDLLGEGEYWVRPPYGLLNDEQLSLFSVPLVHWSVDSEDWKFRDTAKDVESVLSQVKPNAIILMHDIYNASVDAALQIIDTLQEQGYEFVTVEELLALNGTAAETGILYQTGTGREW